MAILLIFVGLQTFYNITNIKSSAQQVVEEHQPAVISSMKLIECFHDALSKLSLFMLSSDPTHKEAYLEEIGEIDDHISKLKGLTSINTDSKSMELIENIESSLQNTFKGYQEELFALESDTLRNFPAIGYAATVVNPLFKSALGSFDEMIQSEKEQGNDKRHEFIDALFEARYSWMRVTAAIRMYLLGRKSYAQENTNSYLQLFSNQLDNLNKKYGQSLTFEQEEAIENINNIHNKFIPEWEKITEIHNNDGWRQDAYLFRHEIGPFVESLKSSIKKLIALQTSKTGYTSASLISQANHSSVVVVILLLVTLASIILLAYLFIKKIIDPMSTAVDEGMRDIHTVMSAYSSNQETTLDIHEQNGHDAIGNVGQTFRVMTETLQNVLEKQKESKDDLEGKIEIILDAVQLAAEGDLTSDMMIFNGGEQIDKLANNTQDMITSLNTLIAQVQQSGIQVTSSATEIAATAKQQEATVAEQAASTNEVMATINQIAATSKELAKTMDEVNRITEGTASSATEGQEELTSMEDTMHSMQGATESISSKLAVLNEKASNINNVVTTINKVADQTNLLSLNAAIEAEKAGEFGRGFAVVAAEIRRLADQTAVATWDIEQMVKEMLSAVSAGVMGMDKFSEEINRGADEVSQVGGKLGQIIAQVKNMIPLFESVTQGMQFQNQGTTQINESVTQLNDTAQQTAESLHQSSFPSHN